MKHKGIQDSCPKHHTEYLGHFRKDKFMKAGHNWVQFIPMALSLASTVMKGMGEAKKENTQSNAIISAPTAPAVPPKAKLYE